MPEEATFEIDATDTRAPEDPHGAPADWQTVDRALRTIARRRAALDADEARWLREAEVLQIWHPLGMVSALDYMERVLGYGHAPPRTGCGWRVRSGRCRSSPPASRWASSRSRRCAS